MNFVSEKADLGNDVVIGIGTIIEEGVTLGVGVKIGNYCIIKSGVSIGNFTVVMDYVEIRTGTTVGTDSYIDSRVSTSGDCKIGNRVNLRYGAIVARGCIIEDDCYLSPRVMTNNLDQGKRTIGGAHIKKGCFIGTQAVLQHGIVLGENSVVGAMAFVTKSFDKNSVLIGVPAKLRE